MVSLIQKEILKPLVAISTRKNATAIVPKRENPSQIQKFAYLILTVCMTATYIYNMSPIFFKYCIQVFYNNLNLIVQFV